MKKTLLTLAIAGTLVSSAFSQGWVFFSAGTSASTRVSTNAVSGGAATGYVSANASTTFYYALFASVANTAVGGTSTAVSGLNSNYVFDNSTGWAFVGMATNTLAGRLASAGPNSDGSYSATGVGVGGGHFVAIGWSGNIGSTLSAVQTWYDSGAQTTGFLGQSAVSGVIALGDGGTNPTGNPFGTSGGQLGGFTLGLVTTPEPGTLALCALGGASMLLFRRKK
jgi:hypothetical protein